MDFTIEHAQWLLIIILVVSKGKELAASQTPQYLGGGGSGGRKILKITPSVIESDPYFEQLRKIMEHNEAMHTKGFKSANTFIQHGCTIKNSSMISSILIGKSWRSSW